MLDFTFMRTSLRSTTKRLSTIPTAGQKRKEAIGDERQSAAVAENRQFVGLQREAEEDAGGAQSQAVQRDERMIAKLKKAITDSTAVGGREDAAGFAKVRRDERDEVWPGGEP